MLTGHWRRGGSQGSHADLGPHPLHSPAGTGYNSLLPLLLRKPQKDKVGVRMRPLCCYPWFCFHLGKKRSSLTKPGPFTIYWLHIALLHQVSLSQGFRSELHTLASLRACVDLPHRHRRPPAALGPEGLVWPAAYSVLCLFWKIMMDES